MKEEENDCGEIYEIYIWGRKVWKIINATYECNWGGADYFVQSESPTCKNIDGVPVISLKEMANIKTDKLVFIAVSNTKTSREIEKNIFDQCGADYTISVYNCRNFISDNLLVQRAINTTGSRKCIVCGNYVEEFCPWGTDQEIFSQIHIIGGGYRKNCKCPYCGTIDRERWLYYVLENHTDISVIEGKVLHFAPEGTAETYIRKNARIDYYSGDIVQGKAMHVIDITDIPYRDNMFDYVISNHILEHITDEKKAISEIKRVLKKKGKWVFSFPICPDIETYEDENVDSPEKRLRAYGQDDHVRLYGNDFVSRFERFGFKLNVYSPQDELDDEHIDKFGFIKEDTIIVATPDKAIV